MQEDKIDENMIDLALINIVSTFGYDPSNWLNGFEKTVSVAEKREMLHRISSALCLVDSDSFVAIRDKIEMEYDRRIHENEMTDEFIQTLKAITGTGDITFDQFMRFNGEHVEDSR